MIRFVVITACVLLFGACTSPSAKRRHYEEVTSGANYNESQSKPKTRAKEKVEIREQVAPRSSGIVFSRSQLHKTYKSSVFLIYTSDGDSMLQGSGFFVSKGGLAVSNYHVFEGTSIGLETIVTSNGTKLKVKKVLEKSKELDFIIFIVDLAGYNINTPIPIATNLPEIGEDVCAIGNPQGLESTLSAGIVSSYRDDNCIIQTTAEITHGSSGGVLLNMKGEAIGITTAGYGEANLNFAINIQELGLGRYLTR